MSVFRELFVEVPLAILEAKIRQATPEVAPARLKSMLDGVDVNALLRRYTEYSKRFTWTLIDTVRRQDRPETIVRVRLACGYVCFFTLDEDVMEDVQRSKLFDYVDNVLDGEPRRKCSCVPHIPTTPRTAGTCR